MILLKLIDLDMEKNIDYQSITETVRCHRSSKNLIFYSRKLPELVIFIGFWSIRKVSINKTNIKLWKKIIKRCFEL